MKTKWLEHFNFLSLILRSLLRLVFWGGPGYFVARARVARRKRSIYRFIPLNASCRLRRPGQTSCPGHPNALELAPGFFNFALMVILLSGFAMLRATAQEEQLSLPPQFALAKAPDFSKWQVTFSFKEEKTAATGGGASPAANTPDGKNVPIHPKQLTITRTAPLWHAVLVMTNGVTTECWGDGERAYWVPPAESTPLVLGRNGSGRYDLGGYTEFICNYNQLDYPDLEWVSPQTYVGGGKDFFIFQEKGENGATATIAAATCTPLTWKKGDETRVFQFLSPPTDKLAFPEDVGKISAEIKHIQAVSSPSASQRVLPPPLH